MGDRTPFAHAVVPLLERIGMTLPIVQAPMAGISTPELAAVVSNAGGLGSISVGATDATGARAMMEDMRRRTARPFNVNVFAHAPAHPDPARETAWLEALAPLFRNFGAEPPTALRTIYQSFQEDDEKLAVLLELAPPVVSFHFGLPRAERVAALKAVGSILLSTATNLPEAEAARQAGMDAVVAQGFEAGAHRGMFDSAAPDDCLSTLALTRLLVARSGLPVIAAGGIMDGNGIAAILKLGAVAAQMGTAFVACPESSADEGYRKALFGPGVFHTTMTTAISGRPARCVANRFTEWGRTEAPVDTPDYPIAYDAGKALHAAAKAVSENGFGAHWAGQGAPLARALPASELVQRLLAELQASMNTGI